MLRLRSYSSKPQSLKARLKEIIPVRQAEVKAVRAEYGAKSLGNSTVDMVSCGDTKITGLWRYAGDKRDDLGNFSIRC